MSQQKPDPARPRPRRATTQSKTTSGTTPKPQEKISAQPAPDDREGWKAYWEERQQPWRTEPEIDAQRQEELARRRAIVPDIEKGIYPFRGMKLTRADIEWLLATHENGRGPVDWSDESQRGRKGLDLRGADLCQEDLTGLPLARMHGGLKWENFPVDTAERSMAAIRMEKAYLAMTQLQGAELSGAQLEGAVLREARLEEADLSGARLGGANLGYARLEEADLSGAQLERTNLWGARLDGAVLDEAIFASPQGIGPRLVDVRWGDANLAAVDWSQVKMLGDDNLAQQKEDQIGVLKERKLRLDTYYRIAVRANRQLVVALQAQGLNEEAARFAYRANVLQRKVLWFQMIEPQNTSLRQRGRKLGAWVFSHFLNLVAGYGYRPERSFLAYLLVIFSFMGLYLLTSHITTPHLRWDEALVLSLSSFHGRGFFPQTITLGDPYARLAVTEAVLGLFIEISFIATFTQRFLGE